MLGVSGHLVGRIVHEDSVRGAVTAGRGEELRVRPQPRELLKHQWFVAIGLARGGAIGLVEDQRRRRQALERQLYHGLEVLALRSTPHDNHKVLGAPLEEVTQVRPRKDGKLARRCIGSSRQLREVGMAFARAPEEQAVDVEDEELATSWRQRLLKHELLQHLREIIGRGGGRRRSGSGCGTRGEPPHRWRWQRIGARRLRAVGHVLVVDLLVELIAFRTFAWLFRRGLAFVCRERASE